MQTQWGVRGAPLLTLPTAAAGDCPALHWPLHHSPVSCPEQLAQSSVCQAAVGAGQWQCPSDRFFHLEWILWCCLNWSNMRQSGETLQRGAPKHGARACSSSYPCWAPWCPRCLKGSFPIMAQGSLCFSINTVLLCAHILGYCITRNPWADFKTPVFL